MSAGYGIHSLDWPKFRDMVERPTKRQLRTLAKLVADFREKNEHHFKATDPILTWPTDLNALSATIAERLHLPDWYGDLSDLGKSLWQNAIVSASMDSDAMDLGFKPSDAHVYWDVIRLACKHFGIREHQPSERALSTFGKRPFRYVPMFKKKASFFDWYPNHSMHPPEEVGRMLTELESVAAKMKKAPDRETRTDYEEELLPAMQQVNDQGRMLFILVDT